MASFLKRGKSWRVSFFKFGVRDTGTFDTKTEAREWAAQREYEIANDKKGLTGNNKTLGMRSSVMELRFSRVRRVRGGSWCV